MRIGDNAVGRSRDKGSTLDLTLVARDDEAFQMIDRMLTRERASAALARAMPGTVSRYAVPGLRALKFVIEDALPGGVYASLHAGLHWQKAAIAVLLDLPVEAPDASESFVLDNEEDCS
jgi:hypothetical protein